jgi:CheY-like chemotaxis protein
VEGFLWIREALITAQPKATALINIDSYKNDQPTRSPQTRLSQVGTTYARFSFVIPRKKILLVEDHNECRELLEKLVNCFGYDVIKASSGTEAITQASEKHPDLILMDICLPEMTGDEITARLKANPATRDIPVIITTALQERGVTNCALNAGAAEILPKPFSLTMLRGILDRYLSTDESKENCCS